jgi:PhnB protein
VTVPIHELGGSSGGGRNPPTCATAARRRRAMSASGSGVPDTAASLARWVGPRPKERPMASRLNPYLSFDGDAREAMETYKDVFGGELTVSTFGDMGQTDEGLKDKVMHSQLETPSGFTLMASDTPPGADEFKPGNNFAVSLSGDDEAELRGYFDGLAKDGNVTLALDKQMWGDVFGMVADRFGVTWMVNITQPQG